jgi:Type VI secretion system/phage-baseplate injector OB domain
MSTIIDTIQAIIQQELRRVRIAELGVVEAVYPHSATDDDDNYGCDVRLKNSNLLLKRVPIATNHIGTAAIPYVGDLVLLNFDQGSVNQPIIVGRLYNDSDRPPLNNPFEVISRIPLAGTDEKTIKSAIRNISSNSPPREILIEMPPKITLRINDGTVHATAGQTEMTLDQSSGTGGTVTVVAGRTKITMNQDGDVTIEAMGDLKLKATRDLSLEGQNVTIKSNIQTDIEAGTQATLKGNLGATVNGGLSTTIQGTTNTIQGITSFSM